MADQVSYVFLGDKSALFRFLLRCPDDADPDKKPRSAAARPTILFFSPRWGSVGLKQQQDVGAGRVLHSISFRRKCNRGNPDVLPKVYFTEDTLFRSIFDTLDPYDRLDALSRFTVVGDSVEETGSTDSTSDVTFSGDASAGLSAYQSFMKSWNPDLSASPLPEGLEITETPFGWQIDAEEKCTMTVNLTYIDRF